MWHYLKAAFWAGAEVPVLGRVPVNALAVAAFAIFGFVEPPLWLLGLGLETAFLFALAFNPRFQKLADAQSLRTADTEAGEKRQALVRMLPTDAQKRLSGLHGQCERVIEVYRNQQEEFLIDTNRDALRKLEWLYVKLLVARYHLTTAVDHQSEDDLLRKIEALEADIADGEATDALLQSKRATLDILRKRLATLRRRGESIEEIDADLMRIENQVDLILESAAVQGKPQTISADIELASDLVGGALFGESESTIADLDQTFANADQTAGSAAGKRKSTTGVKQGNS
jgi:hypothetical protein